MTTEVSRTPTGDAGVSIVQRVKNNGLETIREVVSSTGEITIDEITTKETITITRTLGEGVQF